MPTSATSSQLTRNFRRQEFDCRDGSAVPNELLPNVLHLARQLEVIRDAVGAPLQVLSGYRTRTWNHIVGGARDSMHLQARAADIVCKGYTPVRLRNVVEQLISSGAVQIGGVGLYKGFLHVDTRSQRARW